MPRGQSQIERVTSTNGNRKERLGGWERDRLWTVDCGVNVGTDRGT